MSGGSLYLTFQDAVAGSIYRLPMGVRHRLPAAPVSDAALSPTIHHHRPRNGIALGGSESFASWVGTVRVLKAILHCVNRIAYEDDMPPASRRRHDRMFVKIVAARQRERR